MIDPFVGASNPAQQQGDTVVGTLVPHGSIHPSPQTLKGTNSGYDIAEPLSGFAHLHAQGTGGTTSYGNFLISPQVGTVEFDEHRHLSPKRNEAAAADAYSVTLQRYATKVSVTPAHYSAIYRIDYPTTAQAQLLFDITRKIRGELASGGAEVTLYPRDGKIIGRVRTKNYWNPAPVDIWFCAKFDQVPTAWGVYQNGVAVEGALSGRTQADQRLAAWWRFDARAGTPLHVKIAVSFTSAAKAEALLASEIPGWDYDGVRTAARGKWNAELRRIETRGLSIPDQRRLATAQFHAAVQPRDRSLDQPDGEIALPKWDDHYTLWDTYRTAFPLMSIIKPQTYASNIAAFINTFEKFGSADTAFVGGRNYHVGQGGDEVDNVIGEGMIRGVPGVDWTRAYAVVRQNARFRRSDRYRTKGYFAVGDASPEIRDYPRARSGSSTLGFALNDFYAATVAGRLGFADDADAWRRRSGSWTNVWNAEATSDGFDGFVISKHVDGKFQDLDPKIGFDGKRYNNIAFYEGTSWVYSYAILQDLDALIEKMGGRVRFNERLEHAFANDLIDISNEPSFSTPWLFHNIGRPSTSSRIAESLFQRFTASAYPGDEDNGAMSSNYIFSRLGIFPKLTTDLFYLRGPRHPFTRLNLDDGKTFDVVGTNTRAANIYVRNATLNGKSLTGPWISQSDILAGGRLVFDMTDRPGLWAVAGATMIPARHAVSTGDGAALFDGRTSTGWNTTGSSAWAQASGIVASCIGTYTISVGPRGAEGAPKSWRLEGSGNARAWTQIDRQDAVEFNRAHQTRSFPLKTAQPYRHYRLTLEGPTALAEWELIYAAPEACATTG